MRTPFQPYSRVLIALLLTVLLILVALMLSRRLLLGDPTEGPTTERHPLPHPSPPVLPGIPEPKKPSAKEDLPLKPSTQESEILQEGPQGAKTPASPLKESGPFQGKARVLPPIGGEVDDDDNVEYPPDMEPELILEEPAEEEPPPPRQPEPSPDFDR